MPFTRCEDCDWVFDAARQACPLCGRCAVCGTTLQQLARQFKSRRLDPGQALPRSCQHESAKIDAALAAEIPTPAVAREQRRYGARRRTAQSETIVAAIVGALFGSPAAFFILPKFAASWLNILASVMVGAVAGFFVNRLIRYFRPGGLDAPAAELRLHEGRTVQEYAELLDEFEIELAAPRVYSRTIEYVRGFSLPQPQLRSAAFNEERRLVLGYCGSEVHPLDRELLRRAGATLGDDDMLLVCIPPTLERRLLRLERDHALGDLTRVGKTVFGVRRVRGQNEFYIVDQVSGLATMAGARG